MDKRLVSIFIILLKMEGVKLALAKARNNKLSRKIVFTYRQKPFPMIHYPQLLPGEIFMH